MWDGATHLEQGLAESGQLGHLDGPAEGGSHKVDDHLLALSEVGAAEDGGLVWEVGGFGGRLAPDPAASVAGDLRQDLAPGHGVEQHEEEDGSAGQQDPLDGPAGPVAGSRRRAHHWKTNQSGGRQRGVLDGVKRPRTGHIALIGIEASTR